MPTTLGAYRPGAQYEQASGPPSADRCALPGCRTDAAQNQASQYEREYSAAVAPYPRWYNCYRADPTKVLASVEDSATTDVSDLAAPLLLWRDRATHDHHAPRERADVDHWGMDDLFLLPHEPDGLDDYASDLTVVRVSDAGHYPMRSHADLVNQVIRDFVRRPS